MRQVRPRIGLIPLQAQWFNEIGVLHTESQTAELPALCRQDAAGVAGALAPYLDVTASEVVQTAPQALAALREMQHADVDLIVLCLLNWSEDEPILRLAQHLGDTPLLIWGFTAYPVRPPHPQTMTGLFRNSGVVVTAEAFGVMRRMGIRFDYVVGHYDNADVVAEAVAVAQAAAVRKALRQVDIGLLPYRNDQMMITYVDEFRLMSQIGPRVRYVSVAQLKERSAAVPDAEVAAYLAELRRRYRVEGVDERVMAAEARASLGMAHLAKELDLHAIALNDVAAELHQVMGLRPNFYPPLYHELGTVVGVEGDPGCTTAMCMQRLLTGHPVQFCEIFSFDRTANVVAAGHAGPTDIAMARDDASITIMPDLEYVDSNDEFRPGAWMSFVSAPGPVTMLNLLCTRDSFQMTIVRGEALAEEPRVPGYPHLCIRLERPLPDFYSIIARHGVTHHWAVVHGETRRPLIALGRMLGLETVLVDAQ